MKVLKFEFDINRDLPFVFEHIYRDDIYRIWSKAFSENGYYVGKIVEGHDIKFLDHESNGVGGKVGRIIYNEYIEFLLEYEIHDGEAVDLETPGIESYNFSSIGENKTHVAVHVTVPEENEEMMAKMWNIATESIIKTLENL